MVKITKKQYESKKIEIVSKIEKLETLLNSIPLDFENYSPEFIEKVGEAWNTTYDEIEYLKKELKILDDEWSRRNWTHQEHVQWDLIISNVD